MARFVEEVRVMKGLPRVEPDDVLPLTEAARRLGVSPQAVIGLCESGHMRRVLDMQEPNPQKRGRVLVADLQKELARRRSGGDSRLKRKRGRPFGG